MPFTSHIWILLLEVYILAYFKMNQLTWGLSLHKQSCIIFFLSRSAIYDVVEEKVDSEPDFQYIPEKSLQDPAQLDQHALRDSMVTLKEGLSSGAILAQFDVRREIKTFTQSEPEQIK